MPELPEVESIRSMLEKRVLNKRISKSEIIDIKAIAKPEPALFGKALLGRKILSVGRKAKYLIFKFDDTSKLIIHLRMTGNLIYIDGSSNLIIKSDENGLPRHARVIFNFDDGTGLFFCDQRKFGRLWFYGNGENYTSCGINRLGPEPLSAEFSEDYLCKQLAKTQRQVKTVLIDQSVISGIGNIYSDEILFKAGILPQTGACDISDERAHLLHDAINEVIAHAIKANRSSIEAYMLGASEQYSDLEDMNVYQKAGKKCKICGAEIEKLKIAGRSSCFCPNCQH